MQKYNEDNPMLVNSMVCTIDILGFSQMIIESCNNEYGNNLLKEINLLIVNVNIFLYKKWKIIMYNN